jgi:hypothetical protein
MSEPALARPEGRELYVRHARLDGNSIARMRAIDEGGRCVVETEVWPKGSASSPVQAGPYSFASAVEATRFVTHAVEAFIALGCEVSAS